MRYLSIILCCLFTIHSFAQDCTCTQQFEFVRKYYEENNPAFQQIKPDQRQLKAYKDSVKAIAKSLAGERENDLCNIYFNRYVNLLKDHHSGIDLKLQRVIIFSSQAVTESFKLSAGYRAFELRTIDTMAVLERLKHTSRDELEGLYVLGDNIRMALLENGKEHYEGIVMKKTNLPEEWHVLLSLDRQGDHVYSCFYNMGLPGFNFNRAYMDGIRRVDGNLPQLEYYKTGSPVLKDQWDFKVLDSNTCYLAIRSFVEELKPQLDALYGMVLPEIKKRKYLILDLRDNGGGAESNYFALLPLLYTKPLELDQMSVWVTADNIKAFEERQQRDDTLIARMKKAPLNTFLSLNTGIQERWTMQGTAYPERVALLYNRNTASAAEGLIVYALQSSKVLTMGESSGGYMGDSDVREMEVHCGKFVLSKTTTKWREKARYGFSGVAPMVGLEKGEDWVKAAVEVLDKRAD